MACTFQRLLHWQKANAASNVKRAQGERQWKFDLSSAKSGQTFLIVPSLDSTVGRLPSTEHESFEQSCVGVRFDSQYLRVREESQLLLPTPFPDRQTSFNAPLTAKVPKSVLDSLNRPLATQAIALPAGTQANSDRYHPEVEDAQVDMMPARYCIN